jgi:hypothetical protein
MKIVIAGSYQQYKSWLRENDLIPRDARYVSFPEQLRGLKDVEVVRTGTWWMNPCSYDDYLAVIERHNV